MTSKLLILIYLPFILLIGCNNKKELKSTTDADDISNHPDSLSQVLPTQPAIPQDGYSYSKLLDLLNRYTHLEEKELSLYPAYLKMGNLFRKNEKHAILIYLDSTSNNADYIMSILRYSNDKWEEIDRFKDEHFRVPHDVILLDYNFDKKIDIGLHTNTSNGMGIKTIELWLSQEDGSYKYIPQFREIGTPKINNNDNIIEAYEACCVGGELRYKKYRWNNSALVITDSISVTYYPSGYKGYEEYKKVGDSLKLIKQKEDISKQYRDDILNRFK